MLVSEIINKASILLEDIENVRWSKVELISWLDDCQRVVSVVRPDLFSATAVVDLEQGTKQNIPSNGMRLLDVVRNMGFGGVTPNRSIRYVDREALDSTVPSWHTDTPSSVIKHFVFDNRQPKVFYVYPPATVGATVEILYSVIPEKIASQDQLIGVPESYSDVLLNYVLYRAYSKDTELAQNAQMATMYLSLVDKMLGGGKSADLSFSPDLNSKGAQPSIGLSSGST